MHYMTNKYIENVLLCITKNKTINKGQEIF